jgi:hypothetical protein
MSIESVQAQKRWREKHREKYNEQQRKFALNYYYNNREAELCKKKHEYYVKKTFKEFLFQKML